MVLTVMAPVWKSSSQGLSLPQSFSLCSQGGPTQRGPWGISVSGAVKLMHSWSPRMASQPKREESLQWVKPKGFQVDMLTAVPSA